MYLKEVNDVKDKSKKKKKGDPNLLIKFTILIFLLVSCVIAYFVCSNMPSFNVKKINAAATKHYTEKQILQAIDINTNVNIFKIDVAKIQKNILKLPYVKKVVINKFFPKTLDITIVEKKEKYKVLNNKTNKIVLIDELGYVLEETDKYELKPSDYLIRGITLDELIPGEKLNQVVVYQLEAAQKIVDEYNSQIKSRKATSIVFAGNAITLVIDEKLNVLLPSSSDKLEYTIRFLNKILNEITPSTVFIDMTKDNPYSQEIN